MFRQRHCAIQVGDRVRSYELPGISDQDYITGTVVDTCTMAGVPRFIIRSVSLTVHGQEEPCCRTFYAPASSVLHEQDLAQTVQELHRVA